MHHGKFGNLTENKIYENQYDVWIITRIGLTEFCVVAQTKYINSNREKTLEYFEELADQIHTDFIDFTINS